MSKTGKDIKKKSDLQSIPAPNEVIQQIRVDLFNLPEVDGFNQLIVCNGYFSKWSKAKAVVGKSVRTVAIFCTTKFGAMCV